MPSKKRKYNARFPAGRIKKIMQSDEEVGKVAQAVPVIISRTLELFVESLLTKTLRVTNARNAKTLSTSHMKQCIMSENRFDFLRELVKNIPDISYDENDGNQTPNIDVQTPSSQINNFFPSQSQQDPQQPQQEPFDLRINSNINNSSQNGNNLQNASETLRNYSRDLKRPWENNSRILNATVTSHEQKIYSPSTSVANIEHSKNPKLLRTNSLIDEKTNKQQRSNHQPFLQHQPKSVPNFSSSSSTSFAQELISPPIINIDLSSKATIKIDYTNIMQQQQQQQKQNDTDVKLKNKNHSIGKNNTEINPVFNIDLSKIEIDPPIINVNITEQKQNDQLHQKENKKSILRSSSALELDEDYDNI